MEFQLKGRRLDTYVIKYAERFGCGKEQNWRQTQLSLDLSHLPL